MTITTNVAVSGMTCGHCVSAVSEAISALPGVVSVSVDLAPGAESRVTVSSLDALQSTELDAAVDEAGYEVVRP
ncbi:MAG: heavy metal-associated domain-containing protein [Actinomycetota bacterium]|nr:heavy metal-associated domain-containing protein [Actinomycetota bacterium]